MSNTHLLALLNVILLFSEITNISTQDSQPRGRLLTPEEGCGFSKVANTKIVGGGEAKRGAFPWMAIVANVKAEGKLQITCGGSLITSRHVLTAAHCVRTDGVYVVRLGEHDISTMSDGEPQDIDVIRIDVHPNHNRIDVSGDRHNDIAVLTLERDVEFNDRIQPICLPLTRDISFVNVNPFVAGWGKLLEDGKSSKVLRAVQVPVIPNRYCEVVYRKSSHFSNTEYNEKVLCAGNLAGGHGVCHGDSGGPLMLPILKNSEFRMYQIGIASYSIGCSRPRVPGVYTRVSRFIDWIQEKIDQK